MNIKKESKNQTENKNCIEEIKMKTQFLVVLTTL